MAAAKTMTEKVNTIPATLQEKFSSSVETPQA
jgi:hypothetical protein